MSSLKSHETLVEELYARGAQFGYSRTRRHPSTLPYLYGMKNRIDLVDLESTARQITDARVLLSSIAQSGKTVLLVGTKAEARNSVERLATQFGVHYVNNRWIGGTITNWGEIRKRIEELRTLREGRDTNTLVYKTKKEKLMIEREIKKLEEKFGGVSTLQSLPGAVIIIDPRNEHIALAECLAKRIPVIAIANTDCNISTIDYPIVMNDASAQAIHYVVEYLLGGLQNE